MLFKTFLGADNKKPESASLTDMVMYSRGAIESKVNISATPNPQNRAAEQPSGLYTGLYKRNKPV